MRAIPRGQADFSHNLLRTKTDVRALSLNAALRRLRIEGNPFCATGVQHGSYQIAMQHLLPGMSQLDGKSFLALPGPPFLPPPPPAPSPPTPATAAEQHRIADHPSFHRRGVSYIQPAPPPTARVGLLADNDNADDLSITRGWRDSAVVRRSPSLPAPKKQRSRSETPAGGGRGSSSVVRVTAGGGRPSIDPGSYAEMFLASQRKGRSALAAPPAVRTPTATPSFAQAPTAYSAAPTSRDTRAGGMLTERNARQQRGAAQTQTGSLSLAQVEAHRGVNVRSDGGSFGAAGGGGIGGKRRHHQGGRDVGRDIEQQSASTSLLSCVGMSRAERAVARRLAWSQARQEGAVGSNGVVQRRRSGSGKVMAHGGNIKRRVMAAATRSGGLNKPASFLGPRGRSASVPPHGVAKTEVRQTNANQVRETRYYCTKETCAV